VTETRHSQHREVQLLFANLGLRVGVSTPMILAEKAKGMALTTAEKLQLAMLCDLAKPEKKRELDFQFISAAVSDNDLWALDWKYPGLRLEVATPPDVQIVCDVLEMWDHLEASFAELGSDDKVRVELESHSGGPPRFLGFDGNNETELMHIARLLVDHLDRWSRFKGRDFNSHFPSVHMHSRFVTAWRPIRDRKVNQMRDYGLSADEMIAILRERVHPEYRQPKADSEGWTFDPESMKR
jgi:uncharacterized protein YfbU (UPF0304 family)